MDDLLVKMAPSSGMSTFCYSFQQLPKEMKESFQLDKCQLSSIRRFDRAWNCQNGLA